MLNFLNGVYSHSVSINANVQDVWKTLTETSQYPQWNSFTPQIKTDWLEGQTVLLKVRMNPWLPVFPETNQLIKFQDEHSIIWGMSYGKWLTTRRLQKLIPSPDGKSTYYHNENSIKGHLGPLVTYLLGALVARNFNRMAMELKTYCEQ